MPLSLAEVEIFVGSSSQSTPLNTIVNTNTSKSYEDLKRTASDNENIIIIVDGKIIQGNEFEINETRHTRVYTEGHQYQTQIEPGNEFDAQIIDGNELTLIVTSFDQIITAIQEILQVADFIIELNN